MDTRMVTGNDKSYRRAVRRSVIRLADSHLGTRTLQKVLQSGFQEDWRSWSIRSRSRAEVPPCTEKIDTTSYLQQNERVIPTSSPGRARLPKLLCR
jgi:hypothetical protein